jgi:hypothetical protein
MSRWLSQLNSSDTSDNVDSEMTRKHSISYQLHTIKVAKDVSVACKNAGCNDIMLAKKLMLHVQELQNLLF